MLAQIVVLFALITFFRSGFLLSSLAESISMPNSSSEFSCLSIPYTVRPSRRARNARLKFSPYEGLIVVVPAGFDRKLVPGLIESHRAWIRKVQRMFDEHRSDDMAMTGKALPDKLDLSGIGQSWSIVYRHEALLRPAIRIRECGTAAIELSGSIGDFAQCLGVLEGWLRQRAKLHLGAQIMALASEHSFSVSGLSFRKQRSRWGSCSSKGMISLNLKLLFLPPELVRYIMIHELCHTLHMNHSNQFWAAVAQYDPDCLEHDRRMKHAWRYVPAWFAMQ